MPVMQGQSNARARLSIACLGLFVFIAVSIMIPAESVVTADVNEVTDTEATATEMADLANRDQLVPRQQSSSVLAPVLDVGGRSNSATFGSYRVITGDSLYWIAENYDTTISDLKVLNKLESDRINPGQLLKVPLHTLKEYPIGVKLTDKEVQWLAQMIHAEARGEPYLGQVAVGAVILNRLKSRQFPQTLRGVLFQTNAFQPIRNGSFFRPANDMAYRAALEALNGHDPTNGALFFFNPNISNDRFMHARTPLVTIGRHRFMK